MAKTYKIVKPFLTFHPEITIDGKVRPAFYGLEWDLWVREKPKKTKKLHYMLKFEREDYAKDALTELESYAGPYGPWRVFYHEEWQINKRNFVCELNTTKYSSVFYSKNHSE